jgi:hypothetical protein
MDDIASDKKIKWYHWLFSYLSWFLTVALGFVIFFMVRTTIRIVLFDFIMKEWLEQGVAIFFEKFLVLIAGLVILGFIVFIQDYFYRALAQNLLLKRLLRVLGIELLVVFVFNAFIVVPKYFSSGGMNLLLLIGFELAAGVFLLIFSFRYNKMIFKNE